jgi:hypothetical protein
MHNLIFKYIFEGNQKSIRDADAVKTKNEIDETTTTSASAEVSTLYVKEERVDTTPTTTMNESTMDDANGRSSSDIGRNWKLPWK